MTVPPSLPYPEQQYREQAPLRSNYAIVQRDDHSGGGNYLICNPPFAEQLPVHFWRVLAGNHDIDSKATQSALAKEFARLVKTWKQDVRGTSSLTDMVMHPSYQRIMAMGKPALPLILQELREHSGHWFYALEYIAGKDVAAGAANMAAAKAAWLGWDYLNERR